MTVANTEQSCNLDFNIIIIRVFIAHIFRPIRSGHTNPLGSLLGGFVAVDDVGTRACFDDADARGELVF